MQTVNGDAQWDRCTAGVRDSLGNCRFAVPSQGFLVPLPSEGWLCSASVFKWVSCMYRGIPLGGTRPFTWSSSAQGGKYPHLYS